MSLESVEPSVLALAIIAAMLYVRGWLMQGAKDEDANYIKRAIENLSDSQLNRRMARMLSKNRET